MFRSAPIRFAATLLVSVLGFVLALDAPGGLFDEPLALQAPRR